MKTSETFTLNREHLRQGPYFPRIHPCRLSSWFVSDC